MIIIFILSLLISIFSVNCVISWQNEVNGHDKASRNGYAGVKYYRKSDFYLCSERKYRVHYEGFPPDEWTEEFTACQPAGNGEFMDAIAISGGLEYGVQFDEGWGDPVTCYNISDPNCYAGIVGNDSSYSIYIYGDEYYRVALYDGVCANEKNVSRRVINNFFKKTYLLYDYEKETKININIKNDHFSNVTVQLFNTSNLNLIHFKGTIMIKIIKRIKQNDNTDKLLTNYLKNYLNEEVGLDKNFVENSIDSFVRNLVKTDFRNAFENGKVSINFYWLQNLIEIDIATKITSDYHSYRGGFRIKIYLNDEDTDLLLKIKNICKSMINYTGIKITTSLKEKLFYFTSFNYVDDVMKQLGAFSTITEKIIFFLIWERIIEPID